MESKRCTKCVELKPLAEFRCIRMGLARRRASCKQCERQADRQYCLANSQKIKDKTRRYYLQNREHLLDKATKFRTENPEKVKAMWARWAAPRRAELSLKQSQRGKEFPEIGRSKRVIRRAREKQATPKWANRFFMAEAYRLVKLRKQICGGVWHVDHIVPIRSKLVCGLHCETNLRVVTGSINCAKHNSFWPDMPV